MDHHTAGDRLLYMDHPTAGDRLLNIDYPKDWRQSVLHGPSYRLEIGYSTWTILQTRDRLLYMDHPTAGDSYMD